MAGEWEWDKADDRQLWASKSLYINEDFMIHFELSKYGHLVHKKIFLCLPLPWDNRTGWLGMKH